MSGQVMKLATGLELKVPVEVDRKCGKTSEGKQVEVTLNMKINDTDLSIRTCHALTQAGINTVAELAKCTYADLEKIKNLGKKSVLEVRELLGRCDVELEVPNGFLNNTFKLQIPKDAIKSGRITVTFDYDKETGDYQIVEIQQ